MYSLCCAALRKQISDSRVFCDFDTLYRSDKGARLEEAGRWKKGRDAPVSGRTEDKVKITFPSGGQKQAVGADALTLEYNGALQLERIINNAGNNLLSIFQSIGNPADSQFWQEDNPKRQTAKAMFQKLKDLFTNTATNIRFETSDLRRAQLEVSIVPF